MRMGARSSQEKIRALAWELSRARWASKSDKHARSHDQCTSVTHLEIHKNDTTTIKQQTTGTHVRAEQGSGRAGRQTTFRITNNAWEKHRRSAGIEEERSIQ